MSLVYNNNNNNDKWCVWGLQIRYTVAVHLIYMKYCAYCIQEMDWSTSKSSVKWWRTSDVKRGGRAPRCRRQLMPPPTTSSDHFSPHSTRTITDSSTPSNSRQRWQQSVWNCPITTSRWWWRQLVLRKEIVFSTKVCVFCAHRQHAVPI